MYSLNSREVRLSAQLFFLCALSASNRHSLLLMRFATRSPRLKGVLKATACLTARPLELADAPAFLITSAPVD